MRDAAMVRAGTSAEAGGVARGARGLLSTAAGLAAGRGLASLVSAVWLVVAARRMSLADFGDLGLLLATTGILVPVSERGMQSALAIHVATCGRIDAGDLLRVLARRLPLAVAASGLNAALFFAVSHSHDWRLPLLAAGTIVGTSVYGTVLAAYRSIGLVRMDALNDVVSRLGVLGVGTAWLLGGGGLLAAVACYGAADILSAVVVSTVAWRRKVVGAVAAPIDLRVRATLPLAVIMIVTVVYYRVDTYLVGLLKGSEAAGLYSASYRFLDAAALLPLAVGGIILSRAARQTLAERRSMVASLAWWAVVAGLPVTVAGVVLGGWAVRTAFGAGFAPAGTATSLLMLGTVPTAFIGATLPVAMYGDRALVVRAAVATLVLNVAANLALIPWLGVSGAASVNLATQCVLAVAVHAAARRPVRIATHGASPRRLRGRPS